MVGEVLDRGKKGREGVGVVTRIPIVALARPQYTPVLPEYHAFSR